MTHPAPVQATPPHRPLIDDADFTLHVGDALDVLRTLPDESVHTVVTSPPYWGLRDYGTGSWAGGDPDCDHQEVQPQNRDGRETPGGRGGTFPTTERAFKDVCGKCGATRTDQQLGLEPNPEAYVARMVEVFREVRRVLRKDGSVWINLGDSYAANRSYQVSDSKHKTHEFGDSNAQAIPPGLKPKDLVGIPWKVAFALQADGWYLRSEIIWAKKNCMPESVTDRPTKSHEQVFLLTRSPRYYFDQEAIREDSTSPEQEAHNQRYAREYDAHTANVANGAKQPGNVGSIGIHARPGPGGRNARSVWTIATQPYAEAHFATFPEELPRRCIAAGTSEYGCCPECGAPWEREVESGGKPPIPASRSVNERKMKDGDRGELLRLSGQELSRWRADHPNVTTGWRPTCNCLCPACTIESFHDTRMPELPEEVRAEVGEQSFASAPLLQSQVREQVQRTEPTGTHQDDEGLYRDLLTDSPVGVEPGLHHGASAGDGEPTRSAAQPERGGPSPQRDQGRQPAGESGSDDATAAQPATEEAAASAAVPALQSADLGHRQDEVQCAACGVPLAAVSAVVLDPFAGSGTVALVARKLGRRSIGIELNPDYGQLAARRLQQLSLLT